MSASAEPAVVEGPPERLRLEHHPAHARSHRAVGETDADHTHPPLHGREGT